MSSPANPMLTPRITKVTVNIGVGEGGNRLILAEKVLESLTKQKPVRTLSRKTNRDLGTRIGAPIGCKVTIRDSEKAHEFLKNALWVRENTIHGWSFDDSGNLSFGIADYTDFPEMKYDPDIGIFGLDVNVVVERPGHRVQRRRHASSRLPRQHRVSREECKTWFKDTFGITIMEE